MSMNRLELLLAMSEFDVTYQPKKSEGLYIYTSTTFLFYGSGRVSEQRMKQFVENVTGHKVLVSDPDDQFFTSNEFEYFDDYTIGGRDHIQFDFIFVPKNQEEKIIPLLQNNKHAEELGLRVVSFAYMESGEVCSAKKSKEVIASANEVHRLDNLKDIAAWKHDQTDFFNSFAISSFAGEHFGILKDAKEIDAKFRQLSKAHHPDKGGEELMFKALATTRRYLKGEIKRQSQLSISHTSN